MKLIRITRGSLISWLLICLIFNVSCAHSVGRNGEKVDISPIFSKEKWSKAIENTKESNFNRNSNYYR